MVLGVSLVKIIQCLLTYMSTTPDTYVNDFYANGKTQHVFNTNMFKALQAAASSIGKARIGFKSSDIGTHSIRLGSNISVR